MKVLFAARMARYDLLRATQGLFSRVTKWSHDCDVALHRLMSYIHRTLDHKTTDFLYIGDPPEKCKLWLFADSDHAGEHDSRSTSGCVKQTSTAMSSTEAEVVSANLSMRTVGLPSSCLWQVIRQAGGVQTSSTVETEAKMKKHGKQGDKRDH